MNKLSSYLAMALGLAAMTQPIHIEGGGYRKASVIKNPLTNEQKRRRKKNKQARKSRKRNRRYA